MKKAGVLWISLAVIMISANYNLVFSEEKKAPDPPIHIQSNTLEAFGEKRLVVFSGNAIAIRGDMVLRGDKILVFYRGGEGEVDRIEVHGNVMLTQKERTAQGEKAIYDQGTQQIIMTGNTVLKEGKNIVRGEKIIWIIPEKRGIVEGEGKKRVTATIYPSEREERKVEEAGGKRSK
ncbi:MAG: lipopolysaccharide transport periplasmic protein LptA [Syntrophales bacterium]|nr:lipopolysaccharide transport periplasmic protein LptA [Syntrophales bacterium]